MALEHTVTRHEHRKHPETGEDEIFINIETWDENGEMSNHGRWLTPMEVADILEEEKHGKTEKKDAIHKKYMGHAAAQHPQKVQDRLAVAEAAKKSEADRPAIEAHERAIALAQAQAAVVQAQLQLAQLHITNPEAVEAATAAIKAGAIPVAKADSN